MASPVTYHVDAEAIGWIAIDDGERRVCPLGALALAGLRAAVDSMATAPIRAVVLTGGSSGVFSAGADLRWIESLQGAPACSEASRKGQRILEAIESLPVPVVCAIDGACLGGGLELALACHWRLASDHSATRLGCPETRLGMIPGWGGSVRLPRLVGAAEALDLIVSGRGVDPHRALALGLVDELAPPLELRERAASRARELALTGTPLRLSVAGARPGLFAEARQGLAGDAAALAAVEVLERTANLAPRPALEIEAEVFGRVASSPRCKDLLHAFFVERRCRALGLAAWGVPPAPVEPAALQPVGLRGADASLDRLAIGFEKAGVATLRLEGGDPASAARCPWVIASSVAGPGGEHGIGWVRELPADALVSEVGPVVDPRALAEALGEPRRASGLCLVSYCERSTLVELSVPADAPAPGVEGMLVLLRKAGFTPVVCRPGPADVVTRILFSGLNTALALWESGVPGSAIDGAFVEWGWGPGPLRLLDSIGLDLADAVLSSLDRGLGRRFTASGVCRRLAQRGLLGRKSGCGFYSYGEGGDAVNRAALRFVTGMRTGAVDCVTAVVSAMVAEARRCLAEGVVASEDMVDFMMAEGAGFPRERGGLLHGSGRGSAS